MFAQVKLLNRFHQPLLYAVPESLAPSIAVGSIVHVPLRNAVQTALVVETFSQAPESSFTIKPLRGLAPFPQDPYYHIFIKQLSRYYACDPLLFIERIHLFLEQESKKRRKSSASQQATSTYTPTTLTQEQQCVYDFLAPYVTQSQFTPTLLHGITGSGKTEVYKALIKHAIEQRKSAVLLLPEVTLAIQFERLMRRQLPPDITIVGFHSGTPQSEKRALWQRLMQQEPTLIIGVHLPILLPLPNLGIIIIDEEHEVGYQEKKHPKISTKDAALLRATISKIPILLGSATPSITSLYNVRTRGWHFFQLKHRFTGALPTIETVYLSDKKRRDNFWISTRLQNAIATCLEKREQCIVFINRRGFSFFVQCKSCSFIFSCTNCSVSLTLHADNRLTCHYCGVGTELPQKCSRCKATEFLKKGIGTQQVVAILEKLFPQARIGRADLDTSSKKKVWQQTLRSFEAGELDILVGTQTITKGFHFPRVTLVGILWADLNLHFPMFNASETTLQQLIQVAGRAGRAREHSTVIVQAMAEHPIFDYLSELSYPTFYDEESKLRKMVGYPPYMRLAEVELKHHDEAVLEREANDTAAQLRAITQQKQFQLTILGPAKPPVHKVKNMHARKIYIKGASIEQIVALVLAIKENPRNSRFFFTPNPVT